MPIRVRFLPILGIVLAFGAVKALHVYEAQRVAVQCLRIPQAHVLPQLLVGVLSTRVTVSDAQRSTLGWVDVSGLRRIDQIHLPGQRRTLHG